MENILITGGAGFIGTRLTEKLYKKGYNITVLDNLSEQVHGPDPSESLNRIKLKCKFIHGDVRSSEDWEKAIKNQDIIVHLAAETGTGQSMYKIGRYTEVNVMGISIMLDVLSNNNHSVKKIVLSSSRSIYGEGKYSSNNYGVVYPSERKNIDISSNIWDLRCEETGQLLDLLPTDENSKAHPSSLYGMNKKHQEDILILMSKTLNIDAVILRYQNVYGPGQSLINPYTGILSIFSTQILNNNDIEVYEDGLQTRDFVYIDDVVEATVLSIESDEASGKIFNVGSGEATTVKEVADLLKILYDSDINIKVTGKYRHGDIRHNYADISKIKKHLSYLPKYDFETGIKEFVKWVLTQKVNDDNYNKSLEELLEKGLIINKLK